MTENYKNWEQDLSLPDSRQELEKIQKNIRKKNQKNILTSVILVIVLFLLTMYIFIPAAEQFYWDPTLCTYLENVPDTELTLSVYTELFGHGKVLMIPEIQKTGFASYTIDSYYLEWESLNSLTDISYSRATIKKGQWNTEAGLFQDLPAGIIYRDITDIEKYVTLKQKESAQQLQSLPEYIQILAAVTFSRDFSMKELDQLIHQYTPRNARFLWAALRTGDTHAPPCGILLNEYDASHYQPETWATTDYPDLFPERYNWSHETMEQHVLSMLRFSANQAEQGTGLVPDGTDCGFYQRALDYMKNSGVRTYGCYLIATPEVLRELMTNSSVACISLEKAWIGV